MEERRTRDTNRIFLLITHLVWADGLVVSKHCPLDRFITGGCGQGALVVVETVGRLRQQLPNVDPFDLNLTGPTIFIRHREWTNILIRLNIAASGRAERSVSVHD